MNVDFGDIVLLDTETNVIRMTRSVMWRPMADITAHEIALALPCLISMMNANNWYYIADSVDCLPEGVRRHFEVEEK